MRLLRVETDSAFPTLKQPEIKNFMATVIHPEAFAETRSS